MKHLLKCLLLAVFLFSVAGMANAGWVNGYYRSNGTYVDGYYRSDSNGLKYDNYSWSWGDDLYNDSYYDYSRPSYWREPSWEWQDDYWTGLDYYDDYNAYNGYWDYGY